MTPKPYPNPESWDKISSNQRNRTLRTFGELQKRSIPVFSGPLVVEDDEDVVLQPPQEVAKRVMVLFAVALKANRVPEEVPRRIMNTLDLWSAASPNETKFLNHENPRESECLQRTWLVEAIWVLMWALGRIEILNWPDRQCDVELLILKLRPLEKDPTFIAQSALRDPSEILDAYDLTLRLHWAIRDAMLRRGGTIPKDLDWSHDEDWCPVPNCDATGIVEQRHWTLSWLTRFMNPSTWDDVETPT